MFQQLFHRIVSDTNVAPLSIIDTIVRHSYCCL